MIDGERNECSLSQTLTGAEETAAVAGDAQKCSHQLSKLQADTTPIVISVGGNDALSTKDLVRKFLARLAEI